MVCHVLHDKGLPCITQSRFATQYTSRVSPALLDNGLPRIKRQGFAMHYTTKVCLHYWPTSSLLYRQCIERCLGVLRHLPPWVVVGAGVVSSGVVVGASKGVVVGDWDSTVVAVRSQDTPKRRAIFLRNLRTPLHLLLDQNTDRHGPVFYPRHSALQVTFRMSWHTVGPW